MRSLRNAAGLLAGVLLLSLGLESAAESPIRFRFAISSRLFSEVNENDAKAAIKVWARTAVGTRGVPMENDAVFIESTEGFIAAFQANEIEAASMPSEQYVAVRREVELTDHFAEAVQANGGEVFLLLVHRDSKYHSAADLKGCRLEIYDNVRANLAFPWLDVTLVKQGLAMATNHFAELARNKKLSAAVLPVFFRKAEACLVPKSSFQTLVELNPQLGLQLRSVAESRQFVTGVCCFRANWNPPKRSEITESFLSMGNTVAGQQILTVFQSGKPGRIADSDLDSVRELLAEHERLSCEPHLGVHTPAPTSGTEILLKP